MNQPCKLLNLKEHFLDLENISLNYVLSFFLNLKKYFLDPGDYYFS